MHYPTRRKHLRGIVDSVEHHESGAKFSAVEIERQLSRGKLSATADESLHPNRDREGMPANRRL